MIDAGAMVGAGGVSGSCVNRSMPAQNGQREQVRPIG